MILKARKMVISGWEEGGVMGKEQTGASLVPRHILFLWLSDSYLYVCVLFTMNLNTECMFYTYLCVHAL